ncbi:MAG: SRPBCC domain-containing protein [Thermoanaerobaculia bacterium]
MSHREIVTTLAREHPRLGPWWQQMVTVTYERARGLREKHQKPEGYEISVSRTIGASAWALYGAWKDAKARSRWLSEKPIVIRKAAANKRLRITWADGKSSLDVWFNPRGSGKSQIVVQHGKLPDGKVAARMKKYWARALERLKESLEP